MAATVASTGYLQLASLSWFLYDWAIRLAEELDFLRARPWSFARSLYIFIRYITLALLVGETVVSVRVEGLSPTRCTTFVSVRTAGTFVVLIAVFVAIQSCISKLYNGSGSRARALGRANAALGAVSLIIAVVLEGVFAARNDVVTTDKGSCYTSTQHVSAVSWIAPLCFTLYITVLAALKFKPAPQAASHPLARFECETLAQLFGVTCLPCLALLPMSLTTLVLLRGGAPATAGDGGNSIVQAASAICATRILAMMSSTSTRNVSASAALLDPAHLELGAVRHMQMHRAKDSYWSQQDTLVTALSPRSAVFPSDPSPSDADADVDLASTKKKRFSRRATTPLSAGAETVELDLETEHARNRALLVSAIVTRAEMDFEFAGDGDDDGDDDDSSFNIVDGDAMKGLSPDRETPPRRLSSASLRVPNRNSSRASLGTLSREMLASTGEGGAATPRRASLPVLSQDVVNSSQPGAG